RSGPWPGSRTPTPTPTRTSARAGRSPLPRPSASSGSRSDVAGGGPAPRSLSLEPHLRLTVRPVVEGDLERAALVRPGFFRLPHIRVVAGCRLQVEAAVAGRGRLDRVHRGAAVAGVLDRHR